MVCLFANATAQHRTYIINTQQYSSIDTTAAAVLTPARTPVVTMYVCVARAHQREIEPRER